MFRAVFNTAFIRSNILTLNRDEVDTLWDIKEQFPKGFGVEVMYTIRVYMVYGYSFVLTKEHFLCEDSLLGYG